MTFLKTFIFYFFVVFSFISCEFRGIKNFSELKNIFLPSQSKENLTKEPINKEALQSAKNSVWEIRLYLDFEIKTIDFYKNSSLLEIEESQELIYLGHGSGFFIAPRLMITNFHVIDSANQHVAIISNKNSEDSENGLLIKDMEVVAVSAVYDLALLRSDTAHDSFLEIRKSPLNSKSDSFFLLAYPDNDFILSPLQFNSSQLKHQLLKFNRNIKLGKLKGASGGPIIDQNAEVVAVNQSGNTDISIGISKSILSDFLEGNHRDCSDISLEDCLQQEWLHLKNSYESGNLMAKHRMDVNQGYTKWLNKNQKFQELIEKRQKLNEVKELYVDAQKAYHRNDSEENQKTFNNLENQYSQLFESYDQTRIELNQIFKTK